MLAVYCCTPKRRKIPGYDVGAGFLGILVDFLASSGCLRAWPGPQWAMVGHGGRLVAETDEEATDERPCHLPAWGGATLRNYLASFQLAKQYTLGF